MLPPAPTPTLFPYTTLFRSPKKLCWAQPLILNIPRSGVDNYDQDTGTAPTTGTSSAHHRSEEHTSELQSRGHLVCRLLLEKKKNEYVCRMRLAKSRR